MSAGSVLAAATTAGCSRSARAGENESDKRRNTEHDTEERSPEWGSVDRRLESVEKDLEEVAYTSRNLEEKYSGFTGEGSQILDDYFAVSGDEEYRDTTDNDKLQVDAEAIAEDEIWYEARRVNYGRTENLEADERILIGDEPQDLSEKNMVISKPALWQPELESQALELLQDALSTGDGSDLWKAMETMVQYEEIFEQFSSLKDEIDARRDEGYQERMDKAHRLEQELRSAYTTTYSIARGLQEFRPEFMALREDLKDSNTNERLYLNPPALKNGLPDFNRDGKVDGADVYEFALKKDNMFVGEFASHIFDLNGDGKVDTADVNTFGDIIGAEREVIDNPTRVRVHYDPGRKPEAENAAEVLRNVGALERGCGREIKTQVKVAEEPERIEGRDWRDVYDEFRFQNAPGNVDYRIHLSSHEPEDNRGGHSEIADNGETASGVLFAEMDTGDASLMANQDGLRLMHEYFHGKGGEHPDAEYSEVTMKADGEEWDMHYATVMNAGYNYNSGPDTTVLDTLVPSKNTR